jgi:CubicO group peptidase (beta-lactamase class C family)
MGMEARLKTIVTVLHCIVAILFIPVPGRGEVIDENHVALIDSVMQNAISRELIAGGVILVGDRHKDLLLKAYGRKDPPTEAEPVCDTALFDLASLTKVVATTPAIMRLVEEGKLSLVDPVARWFPELVGSGKDGLLVMHLLTHTSGLDDILPSSSAPMQSVIRGAALQTLKGEVGSRFHYADLNFILLGELVRRVSGKGLDQYANEYIYAPLGMKDTGFNPAQDKWMRCAATLAADNSPQCGVVQDYAARQLGGVAGHAGLFSTVHDLSLFCRMILNNGRLDGKRVLSERAVEQMVAPYFSRGGKVVRGLGWDIDSPFSSPRGAGFSENSFGHTGYSGSSIWIDPESGIYVIVLTTRLQYRNTREFSQLRGDVSTAVAAIFARPKEGDDTAHLLQ